MTKITAEMVKTLRQQTGQGMMDCKRALEEANGDIEAAIEILRKKGMAAAQRKAERETKEGLVAVHKEDGSAAMVEVVCETDFCARNDEFKTMVSKVAAVAARAEKDGEIPADEQIKNLVQECFNKIGENMRYSRGVKITAPIIGHYIHHTGKVGVLVGIEGEISPELLNDLCMHIAFADPMAIKPEDIPQDVIEYERNIAREQAEQSGKPPAVIDKIVEGKIKKFVASKALLEQPFVRDEKKKVKEVLGNAKIVAFARFQIG